MSALADLKRRREAGGAEGFHATGILRHWGRDVVNLSRNLNWFNTPRFSPVLESTFK